MVSLSSNMCKQIQEGLLKEPFLLYLNYLLFTENDNSLKEAGNAIETMIDILGYTEFQQKLKTRGTQGNPKYERLVSEYGRKKRE